MIPIPEPSILRASQCATRQHGAPVEVRGLYLLEAKLLEALAFNRHPDPEVAELANSLAEWWSARTAIAEAEAG